MSVSRATTNVQDVIDVDRDSGVVMDGDIVLVRPAQDGDCTCIRCCYYRRGRYVERAVLFTVLAVGSWLLLTQLIAVRERVAVMIVATIASVGALLCWIKPLRRLRHRQHPRTTNWPPPISL